MEVWSDRGFTCKFRNARSAFRNLHLDPLSLHTSMRNKQVEFNPYIYTLTTLSKLYRFGYEISVLLIQNTRSLFYGRHYSSLHRFMSLHRKLNVKICLMFIVAENTRSVNIYSCSWREEEPIDFESPGQRSTLELCLHNLVGTMQTIDFARYLSNFICKLLMMREFWVMG